MQLASVVVNGQIILDIRTSVPAWLPLRPRLDLRWFRPVLARALRSYFLARRN